MIETVFKNDDIIVVVKPYGMLSEVDEKRPNVPSEIADAIGTEAGKVFPVHRLDATTEGLMVYALNPKAAAALSRSVENGTFHKKYIAFVELNPALPVEGEMTDTLFFDRKAQKSYVVGDNKKNGKKAVLEYSAGEPFIASGKEITPCKIELKTGRTHQIRAQFASRKSPLVGDGKYGSRINFKGPSLFSVYLSFPWKGKELIFERDANFII